MTFSILQLSLITAHSVGGFLVFKSFQQFLVRQRPVTNLSFVFYCQLLSVTRRPLPKRLTCNLDRVIKSGCCFIALINLTVILCGNINKHVQIGSTYFSAFLKGADRFHYYFQPTSVSSLTFLVVPYHKYIALLLILGSTWRSN